MKVIKFTLDESDRTERHVPEDFTPISVQVQGETVTVWGETWFENPREAPTRPMTFFIVGTGWEVKADRVKTHFIDTVQVLEGAIIWHVYWSWDPKGIRYA